MSVRTFTGAWIETSTSKRDGHNSDVRTFTGAWIETFNGKDAVPLDEFAPSRVRGLKPIVEVDKAARVGSHLHGCVD